MIALDDIRHALNVRSAAESAKTQRRAAVAMILLGRQSAQELFFIRRAEFPGDPWSGDVAFPGGGVEQQDKDSRATAERETREEVGLTLPTESYLGALGEISGAYLPVRISSHVYHLEQLPELRFNNEVVGSFSVPLSRLLDPLHNRPHHFHYRGENCLHPIIDLSGYSERFLWGISYRLLKTFCSRLGIGNLR